MSISIQSFLILVHHGFTEAGTFHVINRQINAHSGIEVIWASSSNCQGRNLINTSTMSTKLAICPPKNVILEFKSESTTSIEQTVLSIVYSTTLSSSKYYNLIWFGALEFRQYLLTFLRTWH